MRGLRDSQEDELFAEFDRMHGLLSYAIAIREVSGDRAISFRRVNQFQKLHQPRGAPDLVSRNWTVGILVF